MSVKRSAERAAHEATSTDPPEPTLADDVEAYFDQVVAGHELDEDEAAHLTNGLEDRGVDPIRYLEGREDDGIYGRVKSTTALVEMLLDDAGAEKAQRQTESSTAADGLEPSPAPEDFEHTPEETETADGEPDEWPPEGFGRPDRWTAALDKLAGHIRPDTLDLMGDWLCRIEGDAAALASRDPVRLEMTGRRHADQLADALDVDRIDFRTEEAL
ncbi:MAG: hypothetical protein ABEN55_00080 [Bradymonadaceae bacterium]